ncbi:merlin:moesin:ezrin:radixin [Trichuris trichiura]|uniref:Moesin/ezrin/radixin homolog 1 n=1 Tax=Trichuris trichiura TaxID=36087 RepID=A0A077ZEL8_TRITR|nr:merlin:moesin:ezrin:radixin [Trichuris trichiura]
MVNQGPKTWTMWSVNGTKKVSKQEDEYINVRVSTMDADLEFSVSKKIRGSELFDLVCRTIGLRETWFFGLQFTSKKGYFDWIDFNRKVVAQDVRKVEDGYHFYFLVKFFPEDVSEELIQDITQHLFFLQVKQSILNMDIYCPPEASVLLASYAVQAKCGDFPDNEIEQGVLVLEDLLPQRVLDQYQMTPEMWEDRIKTWWMNNKSMTKEEAELEYLRIAQDLDMYGMHYFPIHNKKESNLWLGVGSLGINVYEKNNKLTPKASFAWSEIKHISFKEKKFMIHTWDKSNNSTVAFTCQNVAVNKVILELCIGSHNLYLRRRQPDTLEVQQMKARAKQDRARRLVSNFSTTYLLSTGFCTQNEKCKLEAERELRALADKERDRLKQEIAILKEQIIAAQEALKRSEETADLLAEKAHISEEEALVLTKRAADAEGEIQRMRITAIKNEEEKFMMERKAREAELIATRMVEESETRTREAEKLKQDLVRARHAEQLARSKLQEVITNPYSPVPFLNPYEGMQQQVYQPYPCPHPTEFRPYANPVSPDIMVAERDIKSLSAEIEKERTEYLRKSKLLQEQLTELRSEIEGLKVEERQTDLDRAYQESLQTGDDKYATLRKSGAGSTKSRIALFDGL